MLNYSRQQQLSQIFSCFDQLLSTRWQKVPLYTPPLLLSFAYISPMQNHNYSLIIDAGIHGNETSPIIALTNTVQRLNYLSEQIHLIVIPVANPSGFIKNIRYIDSNEPVSNTQSVGDMGHLMAWYEGDILHDISPQPNNEYCNQLGKFGLQMQQTFQIKHCFDLHEDDTPYLPPGGYMYPIANLTRTQIQFLSQLYSKHNISLITNQKTRFNEPIQNGLVHSLPNASFPEIFTSQGATGVTLETTTQLPIALRINFYESVVTTMPAFLKA